MKAKKLFRDYATSILLVVVISVSFFILLNTTGLLSKINSEKNTLNEYKYSESFSLYYDGENGISNDTAIQNIKNLANISTEQKQGNIYLEKVPLFLDKEVIGNSCTLIMTENEALKFYDNNNKAITIPESTQNGVIAGETFADRVYKENGSYSFYVDGIKCSIIGIRKNEMSGRVDNAVYFDWNNCSDEMKEYFYSSLNEFGSLIISINSDNDIDLLKTNLLNKIQTECGLSDEEYKLSYEGDHQNYWFQLYNEIFSVTSLLFVIIASFSVSDLWVSRRKNELAIRMAFGYSKKQISKLLAKDLSKLSVISIFFAAILQIVYTLISGVPFGMTSEFLFEGLLIFIAGIVLIFLIVLQHAVYAVNSEHLAKQVRGDL